MEYSSFKVTSAVLASKAQRVFNMIIDMFLYYLLCFGLVFSMESLGVYGWIFVFYIIFFLYYVLFEALFYRTPGKFLTRTQVVDFNGNHPKMTFILRRTLVRFVPFELMTFLADDLGQGWHDTGSKTYVVDDNKFKEQYDLYNEIQHIGKVEKE